MSYAIVSHAVMALAVAAGLGISSGAHAAAIISPDLQARLNVQPTHRVIVTFNDRSQMTRLMTLTTSVLQMKALPRRAHC